jgi:hypothetical protein
MSDIIYPTLDLFLYDQRNALGESQAEIDKNRTQFQKKLPESVHHILFEQDTYWEDEYQKLLPNSVISFEPSSEPDSLEGYYYPVRLNDTYGLLLDCSINNKTEPQPAQSFATLKTEIERRLQGETATIGQSWLIYGWLPHPETQDSKTVAKNCYESLMSSGNGKDKWEKKQNIELKGQGQFCGATIYEFWHHRLIMKENTTHGTRLANLQDNRHVLIILYPDKATAETVAHFYTDWMRLFCYRNKTIWAYSQSRLLKQRIEHDFAAILEKYKSIHIAQLQGQDFGKTRKNLEYIQDSLKQYSIKLKELGSQSSAIDVNLSNYKEWLSQLTKKSANINLNKSADDLAFLEEFSNLANNKYLRQIHKDTEELEQGRRLLEDMMNAVRSRVELEKAERDRNFQDTVAVIGVGWTVGSFVASIEKLGEDKQDPIRLLISNSQLVPKPWVEPAIPLTYTLTVAFAAALVTWLIRRFCT